MSGILYVVATPIGNLNDLSPRAIDTLKNVDLIAAEDTRNTMKLLNRFDIHTPQTANHKFNERQAVDRLLAELIAGKSIAVVSDAGTPCVNDPGFILVEAASRAGIQVIGIPGCCAAVTAVSASGLPSDTFRFSGFFPREKKDAIALTDFIKERGKELYIFYESPLRIKDTIKILEGELPNCKLCLCNDLTKAHERIYRGTPAEVQSELMANPNAEKGEYALLVYYEPAEKLMEEEPSVSLEALLVDEMVKTGCTLKDAVSTLAARKDIAAGKKEIYNAGLNLKELL